MRAIDNLVRASTNNSLKNKSPIQKDAFAILSNPALIKNIQRELSELIVGEQNNALTLFVVMLGGSLVKNVHPNSLNLAVNDKSGAGKDFLVRQVIKVLPNKETKVLARARISPTVLTYWNNVKTNPVWNWTGKTIYLEDVETKVFNSPVMKVFSSGETDKINYSTITVNQKAEDIGIRGKPVLICTFANVDPENELLRRFPTINLDISEEQTEKITDLKLEASISGSRHNIDNDLVNALGNLNPVNVIVPYAKKFRGVFSSSNLIMRTHIDRVLDYIKMSAAIQQYQRGSDIDGSIESTKEDYEIARKCLIQITSNTLNIPLTTMQKKIITAWELMPEYRILDEWIDGKKTEHEEEPYFPISEFLGANKGFNKDTLYRLLPKLAENGFFDTAEVKQTGTYKPTTGYKLLASGEIKIPTWEELQDA